MWVKFIQQSRPSFSSYFELEISPKILRVIFFFVLFFSFRENIFPLKRTSTTYAMNFEKELRISR